MYSGGRSWATGLAPWRPASGARAAAAAVAPAPYTQAGPVENTSYLRIRRASIRIVIPPGHSREEEGEALKQAAEQLAQRESADATMVFAYRPGDDTTSIYTLGRAILAPNGRWEDAGSSAAKSVTIDWRAVPSSDATTPDESDRGAAKVICRKFRINIQKEDRGLKVSLGTDLPGDTEIMVSVERDYRATVEGKPDTYSESFLEAKSTVAAWRSPHMVDIADTIFRNSPSVKNMSSRWPECP